MFPSIPTLVYSWFFLSEVGAAQLYLQVVWGRGTEGGGVALSFSLFCCQLSVKWLKRGPLVPITG